MGENCDLQSFKASAQWAYNKDIDDAISKLLVEEVEIGDWVIKALESLKIK